MPEIRPIVRKPLGDFVSIPIKAIIPTLCYNPDIIIWCYDCLPTFFHLLYSFFDVWRVFTHKNGYVYLASTNLASTHPSYEIVWKCSILRNIPVVNSFVINHLNSNNFLHILTGTEGVSKWVSNHSAILIIDWQMSVFVVLSSTFQRNVILINDDF